MTTWVFDSDNQGWGTAGGMAWNGSAGHPDSGCMSGPFTSFVAGTDITGLSQAVGTADYLWMYVRYAGTVTNGPDSFGATVNVVIDTDFLELVTYSAPLANGGIDSDWFVLSGTFPAAGTLTDINIAFNVGILGEENLYAYVDTINSAESAPPVPDVIPRMQGLGMAATTTDFYLTAIQGGTVSLLRYDIGTLNWEVTSTFGTAGYDDPTRVLYPVVAPDDTMYLYGRDGNDKQLWYNYGAGWSDISAWTSDKVAVGVGVNSLWYSDVIIVFSDNDVYRTQFGTTDWVKTGDAPSNIRCIARHPVDVSHLYVAGTAPGSIYYSPNYGQSFVSIGGTAIAGTINAIEVSL